MDVHEVTVAEYKQCVQAGVCKTPAKESDSTSTDKFAYNWGKSSQGNHPINGVDWNDANSYCNWKGKRLPTEAEFERALRGGSDGQIYPWGNSKNPPAQYGNYADATYSSRFPKDKAVFPKSYNDGYVGTSPVCSMKRNAYGLCDISGNVWEWNQDWHDKGWYSNMPERNPINSQNNSDRVLRGGSWVNSPRFVRASFRGSTEPSYRYFKVGFRCSRDGE
jgi:formylglycine-generating enzyme required for sulfatase activity